MKKIAFLVIFLAVSMTCQPQGNSSASFSSGLHKRISEYIDTLEIVDTHEHFYDPGILPETYFFDFSLLLQQNTWDGFVAAGMDPGMVYKIYGEPTTVAQKWKIIEPYWNRSFNTAYNRVMLRGLKDLHGVSELSGKTVETISSKIKKAYSGNWFNHVLKDICRFKYVIIDGKPLEKEYENIKYVQRFSAWLTLNSKFRLDSIAVMQVSPIYSLEDYVESMKRILDEGMKTGMVAAKIDVAYKRSLFFDKVTVAAARRVFRDLANGNYDMKMKEKDAKILQDYMMHQLLDMIREYDMPVAFHTGIQACGPNILGNSDPELLTNLFTEYPEIHFVLFHGSYPFGGKLTTLARNFSNVFIDMNWTYSISPEYAERYLTEWLEAVPASKIMAFGGDQRCVENTYGNLMVAKKIITDVLAAKVNNGYFTEQEALTVARMILYDNAIDFYNLP
ncbi:MAG TPA: amidohydrolase family protein [Bacteroidales bacterium]|nr:amidohydrolase family protein [Bacteroidales bacterium]